MGQGPDALVPPAILRLRPRRIVLGPCRRCARHLHALAARAQTRRRRAARPRERIAVGLRSEEHTSELQSLRHLVCRLLLEKKKKKDNKQDNVTKEQE